MPCCAVRVCGNRSSEANFKTCGVTYHRFPRDPKLKEKWINACGRKDQWFPTQHGVICSSHFEEKCFQPIAKSRRLFPEALPTLKLRLVFETPTKRTKHKINSKKIIIKPGEKRSIVEKYKVQIEKYKKGLQQHKMHIKRLQTMYWVIRIVAMSW
ncbi:hypothetical protein PYW07_012461 [Mythimna separata]|uniref:THAP-type domain-containing protein n=1 Tax=Mythimna separata TaxID=271217 RepID=A0AAD8DSN9_MYTSE|nr:hypothetical protein PYW07_012461 [Mythimna separata]